ncbi:MAG: hypothetical protein KF718_01380 [Polyangiaceae bacterium]|nr:hypothetical protein [Polyangiaceae bacterium]
MTATYLDPNVLEPLALLPAAEADRHFDYCLEPYRPRRPWSGKLRAENLLWHSLLVARQRATWRALLEAVQRHVGKDLTVWGVKWDGERLWWELYFYDPRKESARATIASLTEALAPWLRLGPRVPETVPYMMFSFDLSAAASASGEVTALNLYLTGEQAHAGRSYRVTDAGAELENTYRFMEPKRNIDEVLPLIEASVFVDYSARERLKDVLFPVLFACKKVCISKKRDRDAIYFSGIAVDQLLWFLRRFAYPVPLVSFVERHQEQFEHLFFDVGIDYRTDASGRIVYPKTSYYGTL